MIDKLPQELLWRLLNELSYRECANLALTCRAGPETFKKHDKRKRGMARRLCLQGSKVYNHHEAPVDPEDVTLRAKLGPVKEK